MLVAIDPGVRGCGVACFGWDPDHPVAPAGELLAALYIANDLKTGDEARDPIARCRGMAAAVAGRLTGHAVDRLVIEWPRAYRPGKSKGSAADLFYLTCVAGALAAYVGCPVQSVKPEAWKGQVPKTIMAGRIRGRLSPDEVSRIERCTPSLEHNVLDAIGIGLWASGRWGEVPGLRAAPTPRVRPAGGAL